MPATIRETELVVTVGGHIVSNAIAVTASLGYDMNYGQATVTIAGEQPDMTYYDTVTIRVSAGGDTHTWFSGLLVQVEFTLYPRTLALQCRGRMFMLEQFKMQGEINPADGAVFLDDITGGPATDQTIVSTVIDTVGLSLNGGSIGGTGTIMGTVAPEEFGWKSGESALSYIQRIDSISLGYRTFESTGGSIYRTQVSSVPSGGTDMSFTAGVDIAEGKNTRSVTEAFNAVRVGGYAVGDYADPRVWYAEGSADVVTGTQVYSFNSPMIERRADSSPGQGISTEAVANYWLGEVNREIIKLTMTTPRNDDIGPGQIHQINNGSRLNISERLWVQRVDKSYTTSGAVSQSITYIGGGG
jgi:hypothetical protein